MEGLGAVSLKAQDVAGCNVLCESSLDKENNVKVSGRRLSICKQLEDVQVI